MSKKETENPEELDQRDEAEIDEETIFGAGENKENPESDIELEQLVLDQQARLHELEVKLGELKESNLRKTAELDNVRKRTQRERTQLYETAKATAIEHFLPVNDDLQRMLKAIEESGSDKGSFIEDGVRMIYNKFQDVFKRYNVETIDETGVPFDVDIHDALMRQKPDDKEIESDIVLQVLENGYKMGDRTIRHAKVIVSE